MARVMTAVGSAILRISVAVLIIALFAREWVVTLFTIIFTMVGYLLITFSERKSAKV